MPSFPEDDEENLLYNNSTTPINYGCITSSPLSYSQRKATNGSRSQEECSSRGSSDVDESYSNSSSRLAKRKQRRLQQHHRPKLASRLSNVLRVSTTDSITNDLEENMELVLPALDPKAQEVIDSTSHRSSIDQWFTKKNTVNLSTVRSKYRTGRKVARDENTEVSPFNQIISSFKHDERLSAIRQSMLCNRNIILFVNFDMMVDFIFCLMYLVEMKQESDVDLDPPWLYKWRSYDLWRFCQVLSIWDLGSFIMRVAMIGHPLSVLFSFRCCIELLTSVPLILSNFIHYGQYLYVPYFLRSWVLLLRIKSVMKIRTNLQMTDKVIDPLKSKLIHLICTLMVLLYNGMSAFQYCEATFAGVSYSILDSLYVVMVTLSTVGYGDITPRTEGSRVVMMTLIVIALAVLPSLLTDVARTLQKRNDGGGHVSKGSLPFILIVGSFRPEQVNDILSGFLDREHAESHLNVIFLDVNPPTEELKLMERNSMWGHRIQFLHGSVLNEDTLIRVRARYAKAIFTISDDNAQDHSKEDERNTVRLWSLYCFTVVHKVPIYTYNLSPSTAIYQKVAEEIICVGEFKQYLLAMNCRCRGVSTLLTNLLHQRQPMNRYDESWQAQYDDGSCNEIYTAAAAKCLIGVTFADASWVVYKECQVILFAVKTKMENSSRYEILLNPRHYYVIKEGDLCVYMAESPKEVRDIRKMNSVYAWQAIHAMRNSRITRPHSPAPLFRSNTTQLLLSDQMEQSMKESLTTPVFQLPSPMIKVQQQASVSSPSAPVAPQPISNTISANKTSQSATAVIRPPILTRRSNSTGTSSVYSSHSMSSSSSRPHNHGYRIVKLPSTRHALLTGSRTLIARLGQAYDQDQPKTAEPSLPLCYLLDHPVDLPDVVIESADGLHGHILVCLQEKVTNIFKFIYNLRSPYLKKSDLRDIVILCNAPPKPKMFELLNRFPKLYFMVGNSRYPDDLLRAGVKHAQQVVVMSEKESNGNYEKNSDSAAIMTSHLMDLLMPEQKLDMFRIVNLSKLNNHGNG
ncbi:hypothetical protein BCR42DRAFT_72769 [Absidia repens]|uniref:Potassium channel domain-containing protein n=1 Tax=Absidia repens TaxID=90262 RepID=A0A1X2IB86_9FUNG|nr:hypothetical protein BCR42DRAFT_72769 [Absidia repens]